eukprot:COSAG05_NODE_9986_length_589_cov_1.130612_1_plen_68_part_00
MGKTVPKAGDQVGENKDRHTQHDPPKCRHEGAQLLSVALKHAQDARHPQELGELEQAEDLEGADGLA